MSVISHLLICVITYAIPTRVGVFAISWIFESKLAGKILILYSIPICLWVIGAPLIPGKTLSNAFVEPLILAAAVLGLALVRAAFSKWSKIPDSILETVAIAASVLAVLCLLLFMPPLAE